MSTREKVYWIIVSALVVAVFILMGSGHITNKKHFQSSDLNRDGVVDLSDLSILMADLSIDNVICIPKL